MASGLPSARQIDAGLARHTDAAVREAFARQIGGGLRRLSTDNRIAVHVAVLGALETLARDPSARVRAALAEALKDVAEAPSHVIGWLARDHVPAVAAPVLQFSPLLSDEELLSVISGTPIDGALLAISRRADLSPGVAAAIAATRDAQGCDESSVPQPRSLTARALRDTGRLDETALTEALDGGDQACVTEGLALLANVSVPAVARIRAARSGKAMTALAWKAGLSMRFAIRLQARFAGIAPSDVLNARNGFDFPLPADEMEWMLNFFRG